jgi:uncharacterized protein YdeI (YjbR/CyaY-like superfamily)
MELKFFKKPADFRMWLEKHHAKIPELWVGFYKKSSGHASISWPESVDQALCFGWIDGIRQSVDEVSYAIRFTPRRKGSVWSSVNIKRAMELIDLGLMKPSGLRAFERRQENRSGIYSYEQRSAELEAPYQKRLEQNKTASDFFHAQPAWYRKQIGWWIVSAKKEETRLRRLAKLIDEFSEGRRI